MRKIVLTSVFAFCLLASVNSQDYKTGIGLRVGPYIGFTVKHFISDRAALEGLVSSRWKGIEFTGLYEISNQAFDVDRLNWYFGGGAHLGFYNGDNASWGNAGTSYANFGIDGILGLEYSFTDVPISLGIDWKPAVNFTGNTGFVADYLGISIRYIF